MFNKTKKVSDKIIDDTPQIAYDFKCQIPFWEYRAMLYKNREEFENLLPVLDAFLEKLFEGDIDDGNGDVLDCIISDYARMNFRYLAKQRVEHNRTMKAFDIQRKGAKHAFENHLESMEKMKKNKEAEYEEIKKRFNKEKFERMAENE